MMNLLKQYRKLDNVTKMMCIIALIIVILVISTIYINVSHSISYENTKQSGNGKWNEVSSILNGYNARLEELEKDMEILKSK